MLIKKFIKTSTREEILDITREVTGSIQENGIKDGICTIFVPH